MEKNNWFNNETKGQPMSKSGRLAVASASIGWSFVHPFNKTIEEQERKTMMMICSTAHTTIVYHPHRSDQPDTATVKSGTIIHDYQHSTPLSISCCDSLPLFATRANSLVVSSKQYWMPLPIGVLTPRGNYGIMDTWWYFPLP